MGRKKALLGIKLPRLFLGDEARGRAEGNKMVGADFRLYSAGWGFERIKDVWINQELDALAGGS